MNARKFRFVLIGLIILTLAAAGSVSYFGITFLNQKVAEAEHIKVDAEVNNDASSDAAQSERQFADPVAAKLAESLEEIVPDGTYREQFIADVSKYAEDSGVPLVSITFAAEDVAGASGAPAINGTKSITVQLVLGADIPYNDFIGFVEKLESNLQHIQILTLNMQPSLDNRDILTSAGMSVALYVEP